MQTRFHLAFPILDIEATVAFYQEVLSCQVGRRAQRWVDFDFHGHQISAHLVDDHDQALLPYNAVDNQQIPVRHFGLILQWEAWHTLREQLDQHVASGRTTYLVEPYIRFAELPGEQATLFIVDPSGNALEFKAFRDNNALFATELMHDK